MKNLRANVSLTFVNCKGPYESLYSRVIFGDQVDAAVLWSDGLDFKSSLPAQLSGNILSDNLSGNLSGNIASQFAR